MTHRYIGTKEVIAWEQVDKHGEIGYAVKYADGYTSWSPKAAFEAAYRTSEPGMEQSLTFGDALYYLKLGKRVARTGWNGRGMWLQYVSGRNVQIHDMGFGPINEHDHDWRERVPAMLPWIGMKTADNKFVPWLCSQADMLESDWCVLA
jgi:hypothetical protein